jgi:putative ABC transport system permease protein
LNNNEDQTAVKPELQKIFKGQLLRDWMQLSPELDLIINSFNLYMYIFIGIILLALSFGIINTMLMSVLERVRELGMLMAIGMNKPRIFFMIILETILLSLAGSPLGFLISYLTIYYFGVHGLDLSVFSEGLSSFGYASIIYTELDPDFYFKIYFMTLFAALFASLFPAYKALRLKPVDAIRKI